MNKLTGDIVKYKFICGEGTDTNKDFNPIKGDIILDRGIVDNIVDAISIFLIASPIIVIIVLCANYLEKMLNRLIFGLD